MKRRTGSTKLWTTLGKQAARSARRLQRSVTDSVLRTAREQSNAVGKAMGTAARQALSGVATPARPPVTRKGGTGGVWEEGLWGFGFGLGHTQRRYRLYVPPGVSAARPAPLLVLLHGCGQDAASFAASTRVASIARDARWIVLMPEQSVQANAQRCWQWFTPSTRGAAEAALLMSMVDHVSRRYAVLADRVCAMGLSAGGAMAMLLGLRYPDRFAAIASHSGAAPYSATNATQAARAMRGERVADAGAARLALAGRRPPPLVLLHGDEDPVVTYDSATGAAALWLELTPSDGAPAEPLPVRRIRRGTRRAIEVFDWQTRGGQALGEQPRGQTGASSTPHPFLRLVKVEGLRHAWSGGAPGQAFSDPTGPDALKIALRFFSVNGRGAA
ncbi:extracellular catalytic domain type 1 short-chain-length polyhydroxyalkanoate depolymerase [Cupriavidus plantarum]|uniref:extracellular catalytic domain type 1 short-chain-length polyhydroxyalkanoate depolymerase n=1 Tax=Cupriavidus plantarum TaxID=942865 RepID=UPI000EB1CA0D|nr:PHB depolymerase family esterase [Cupriavidus plantarum]RLK28525.1 poly(3-hydroxybutyrate) depolymerase [Cupriavidus plantarum]